MSDQWDDDERNTSIRSHKFNSSVEHKSISACDVMRDFYKDEKNSRYTWTEDDYRCEIKRRIVQAKLPFMSPKASIIKNEIIIKKVEADDDEEEIVPEQLNDEILENQIYKKCWYS